MRNEFYCFVLDHTNLVEHGLAYNYNMDRKILLSGKSFFFFFVGRPLFTVPNKINNLSICIKFKRTEISIPILLLSKTSNSFKAWLCTRCYHTLNIYLHLNHLKKQKETTPIFYSSVLARWYMLVLEPWHSVDGQERMHDVSGSHLKEEILWSWYSLGCDLS